MTIQHNTIDRLIILVIGLLYATIMVLPQILLWRRDCAWSRGTERR